MADADDTPKAVAPDKLSAIATRSVIAAADWRVAIDALRRAVDLSSVDWNNLMGHALCKASPLDVPAAECHHDAALRVDRKHGHALEYSGEPYLKADRLTQAEQRL